MHKTIKLSMLLVLILLPFILTAQENPGDVWCVIPDGIEVGDHFVFEIRVNTGSQMLAAYGIEIHLDFRYYEMYHLDEAYYGIVAGPAGFLSVASPGTDYFICQGFDTSGVGPGTSLHLLNVHCTALENGVSLVTLKINDLSDANTDTIGTPRAINGCLTIGSNGIAGDVNQSGEVNIIDALLVAKYYTMFVTETPIDTGVADVNGNGNIDIVDALLIAQYYVGLIGPLPFSGTPHPAQDPTPVPGGDPTPTPETIDVPDENLAQAIRTTCMLPAGEPIPRSELEALTSNYFYRREISDITGLEYCTSITDLRLSYNQITDLGPLAGLKQLSVLYLGDNSISDLTPLSGLDGLTELYLFDNEIEDITPLELLRNLLLLQLGNNAISDIGPLAGLENLSELWLHGNAVSDISVIGGLTKLTYLNLNENELEDIGAVSDLPLLKEIHFENNNVSDISALFRCPALQSIYMRNNPISEEDYQALDAAFPDAFIRY
ncbi:MAG: leucine-rich repeat domain-containing protein [Spirochaetales bacterium]|nr:leucine-rich repeat domain-containing protein [Spirochaetales bacterium]